MSTLSRIAAREMGGFFLETTASTFETPSDVVRTIWQLNDGCEASGGVPSVLFLDEIHGLGQAKGRQAIDHVSPTLDRYLALASKPGAPPLSLLD